MGKSFNELFEESNRVLLAFLKRELNLGFTFAGMAKEYHDRGNRERYAQNKKNAKTVLKTVANFRERLSDAAKDEIDLDYSKLQNFISGV